MVWKLVGIEKIVYGLPSDINNRIIICFGYAVKGYTVLPISYQQSYVITFGQADAASSARQERSIWYTSDKSLTQFKFSSCSTTTYITIGY